MISIYAIWNKTNNKVYIGQTKYSYILRFYEHIVNAYRNKKGRLLDAIRNEGPETFYPQLIEQVESSAHALEMEIECIKLFESTNPEHGYNLNGGGYGMRGMKHTEEWKERQSKMMSGPNHYFYGKHRSEDFKKKASLAKIGKPNFKNRKSLPIPEITTLYASGKSSRYIAKMFSVEKGTVCKYLKEAGIVLRPPKGRNSK